MDETADPSREAPIRQANAGDTPALGGLLESYRAYLVVLARVQIGGACEGRWTRPTWRRKRVWGRTATQEIELYQLRPVLKG